MLYGLEHELLGYLLGTTLYHGNTVFRSRDYNIELTLFEVFPGLGDYPIYCIASFHFSFDEAGLFHFRVCEAAN
ncbi:MAG: hypothetical protein R6U68_13310, partial [Desulfobacteraceae bacterium]